MIEVHRLIITLACAGLLLGCGADDVASDGGSEETATGDGDGDLGELLVGEPTIVFHPKQPMIIDVLVELDAPGTGELVHQSDDDVHVAQLEPAPGEAATQLHFRVRGLLPASDQPLALSVSEAEGERSGAWSGTVTTAAALPGFIPKFELDSLGPSAVEPVWRLFDMTRLFSADPSGVFMVDDEGTTRWYVGDADDYTSLIDIFQGLHLRPDGTLSYTRRDVAVILDELGEYHMQVTAEQLDANGGFHHDMIELPSGNFLILGYAFADVDYQGEGTLHVAGDMIYEFTPAGELVWIWDSFDHLDPQRRRDGFYNPMKIPDPAAGTDAYDWTHGNGLTYTAEDDTIYVSLRHQDWILAIDHQTGELRWQLGDEGDFELLGAQYWFFHQHSPQWQPDGSLLLYDNAVGNPERPDAEAHSRAVRYVLDFDAMTATQVWQDDDPFFTSTLAGDADLMPGGHILRLDSVWSDPNANFLSARLRELDPEATPNAVWTLTMPPGKFSYRATPIDRFVGVAE